MPLDQDTVNFLVSETIENALQDCKANLDELSKKYQLKIRVRPPIVIEIKQVEKGEVIWEEDK